MSKPVFAYAVMKLCEKGVMDLDTPLTNYTPERFLEGDPRLDLITARRVLSHTTGFPNWRSEKTPLAIQFTPGERSATNIPPHGCWDGRRYALSRATLSLTAAITKDFTVSLSHR
jgi:CubicO group peptidase (beta-lactamase class C family)